MEQRIDKDITSLQFSNVRTFLSGIRTATALMSLGYAVAKFALYLDQHNGSRSTTTYLGGIAMMFVGLFALVLDVGRFRSVKYALDRGMPPHTHEGYAYAFAALIGVTGLVLIYLLFASR